MIRYAISRNRSLQAKLDLIQHRLITIAEGTTIRPLDMVVETRQSKRKIPPVSLQEAVDRLTQSSAGCDRPHPQVSAKQAAVLIPLFESNNGDIHVILTQRSPRLNSHAGEVCFPGGKKDEHDADAICTALREADEELGIPPDAVNVLTTLPPILSKHYLSVTPVIATVPSTLQFRPNPSEVDAVFSAPLHMFLESSPGYSYRDVSWESFPYRLHYWKYMYKENEFLIWGLTAGLLIVVAEKALGRKPDFRVDPPGARPYSALAYENGRLVFRGSGRITSAEIRKDDRLLIPLDEPFGFGSDGKLNITISNFMLRPIYDPQKKAVTKPNLHRMGILITTPYGGMLLDQQVASEGHCPLDSDEQITLLTFDQVDLTSRFLETDVLLSSLLEEFTGGEFMLYFANCEADTAVDFDMILDLYNQKGDKIDYLPVGEDALPLLYFVVFLCFSVLAGAWLVVIVRARRHVQKVHYLMAALVAFKSLTVLSQSGMYHMIALHGHPEGWNVAYYFFTAMRSILFFVLIILIAAGWSYMKPFLADREKQILMIVVPLQVFANIAIIVVDETTPASRSWFSWRDVWHVVDILCCCAILFPIVWSIRQLRDASEYDDKAARVLSKLMLFRQFYIMVVSYIYFTRIIVYLLDATLPYKLIWLSDLSNEVATIAFYVACGLQFRPLASGANPYFALDVDEVEMTRI